MGREIRRVSKNWEHPKEANGRFKPLMDDYIGSLKYYKENKTAEELNPPNINDYMPSGEWYQLFENVSGGTPLSPPFATKKELIKWLVNNKDYWGHQWTKLQAEGIVKCGYSPSMALINGKLYTSEELAGLQK